MKLLHLNFLPRSADVGLLVLRVWLGASMLLLHGWGKMQKILSGDVAFRDPLGIGALPSLILAVFAEVICAALLMAGAWTRLCALVLGVTMGVAFFLVHQGTLSGPKSGELAFVYLAGFIVLLLAGGGRFGFDRRLDATS